ncbi:MAG: YvcK family protein [Candidatus Nomurabacteria bacterium]|jgi:uncharacterized cofD-like protein|nr:YvcK family protein [Candidatus Nomurabacteria bacterium]
MNPTDLGPKIVVVGGGTGSFTVLSGLKNYAENITALVSMADDGGSTRQLMDEYGVLPPGDVRQCLVALSRSPQVRQLFNYRFSDGSFDGHSFGNLFLTALEKMTGNFTDGVELAGKILKIVGKVEPLTLDKVVLCMKSAGRTTRHERNIDDKTFDAPRPELWLEPQTEPNPMALAAVKKADIVVLAPGSLYTSLGAALVVPTLGAALKKSRARVVYFCNLVNKPGQTDDFSVEDHADELERLAGVKFLDLVIYNNRRPSNEQLSRYANDGELPVEYSGRSDRRYKGVDLVSKKAWKTQKGDKLKRTLIRHDPDKLARQIMRLYFS